MPPCLRLAHRPAAPIAADAVIVGADPQPRGARLAARRRAGGRRPRRRAAPPRCEAARRHGQGRTRCTKMPDARAGRLPARGGHRAGPRTTGRPRRCGAPSAPRSARSARHARVHVAIDGPVGALAEGALLGAYAFTAYKSTAAQARRCARSRSPRRRPRPRPSSHGRAPWPRRSPSPATWSTPRPTICTRETFAARSRDAGHRAPSLDVEVLDERGAQAGPVTAAILGRRRRVSPPAAAGPDQLSAEPSRRRTDRPGRQGDHLRLRRPEPQDREHGLDEVRHGRRRRGHREHVALAALKLPVEVTATVPMAENMPSGSAYRPVGRAARCATGAPSRSPTPTPRGGSCWPTRSPAPSRTSRTI